MSGTTHDAISLAVGLAERLGGHPLPDGTVERLRASDVLAADECEAINQAFDDALTSPRLTAEQRQRFEQLVAQVADAHPELVAPVEDDTVDDERPAPRWLRIVAVAVLSIVLVASSVLAWSNYRTGRDWHVRAQAAEADVDRLVAENDTLEQDLAAATDALERSEADVRLLERRVSQAADLKARAEDEREMATAYAERITEIALAYDEVAQWFSACRQEQSTLTSMVFDFESYYYANQTYLVSNQVSAVTEACSTAESYLADVRRYVQALGE